MNIESLSSVKLLAERLKAAKDVRAKIASANRNGKRKVDLYPREGSPATRVVIGGDLLAVVLAAMDAAIKGDIDDIERQLAELGVTLDQEDAA